MNRLDHITVVAPDLTEGINHVRECLDIDIPFGTRHSYMGTHNHRLQLGDRTYLEIIALDPEGTHTGVPKWFGLDNQAQVRADWDAGRRLRGWVASTDEMDRILSDHARTFGEAVELPQHEPEFAFSIPAGGLLPLDGAAPSLIDHRGVPTSMDDIPDMGARLVSFELEHPDPAAIEALYRAVCVEGCPSLVHGPELRYVASIQVPTGLRVLT